MEGHYNYSDEQFEQAFASCQFPPEWFNHEAHIRLAWIHNRNYGAEKAIDNICTQLENFTIQVGAAGKFNKTVSIAAIRAVDHFMRRSKAKEFNTFIEEFPRLGNQFKSIIETHYGFDIFKSPLAKTQYLAPDLLPFT